MLNKTMNASKKIILLRSFSLLCVLAVFLSCIVFPAGAEPLNYRDYETGVTVDGENDIVTVTFPKEYCFVSMYAICDLDGDGYGGKEYSKSNPGTSITFPYCIGWTYSVLFYPTYLTYIDLSNIPNGTTFTFTVGVDYDFTAISATHTPKIQCSMRYYDDSLHDYVQQYTDNVRYDWDISSYSMVLDIPPGMSLGDPRIQLHGWGIPGDMDDYYPKNTQFGDFTVYLESFTATMSISSLYRLQEQTGETNELLDEVNRQLAQQGKTMEDILNQQEQTNDKLDQLPGQIGDEMQGVIESEKEESKSEGNKFVDQILDALPDPSTDVLAALKSLTDATAYTGTDAVLPIPAIVLPGIDGLFPETEIWGGTEFDFGEYLNMLPPTLVTLAQSLFTIAIVLFCVYELKGIISYCLTLRESKGG